MRTIYNEGRVVGLSGYEIYVKQLMSMNPNATPLSEREWLTSTLSESSSMILKVPMNTTRGYHDYPLPENSDLCGCSIVYGSLFEGNVATNGSNPYWATEVSDYGRLIENTFETHPVTPGTPEYVPTKIDPYTIPNSYADRCMNYLKITGALIIQPGDWIDSVYYTPLETEDGYPIAATDEDDLLASTSDSVRNCDLHPDFTKTGFIRIAVSDDLTTDVYILLHGFAYKTLLVGEVGYIRDGYTERPQDGDFLGPGIFPWSCPVVLVTTNDVMSVFSERMASLENRIRTLEQQ